ncbi:MAG: type IV toxin-antitoxin system AbiEi family antitoxin domain-containing protein, partial [Thermoanaerobaculia bacterium]
MKLGLGQQERQLLAYLQMRGKRTVRTDELTGPLRLTRQQERELFRRLARGGLIARVRPGLYLVPSHLPLGGSWSPDEASALNALMEDRGALYQVCGPSAFSRYGFDEQVPNRTYAYNNRLSGARVIGAVRLALIKVADERLGGIEELRTAGGDKLVVSSRVRTLVDVVYDWSRFNGLPRGYDWIRGELAAGRVDAAALTSATLRYGNVGTIRRIGALLDREGVDERLLRKLAKALRPSTSFIPWIPTRAKRGPIDRRWG